MDPVMRYNNRDIVVISLCQAIISCNLAWISISTVNNFDQREEDMENEANGHLACSIPIPDVRRQFHPLPYPFPKPIGLVPNGLWLHRVRASNQSEWGRGNLANVDDTYGISTTITATTTISNNNSGTTIANGHRRVLSSCLCDSRHFEFHVKRWSQFSVSNELATKITTNRETTITMAKSEKEERISNRATRKSRWMGTIPTNLLLWLSLHILVHTYIHTYSYLARNTWGLGSLSRMSWSRPLACGALANTYS